MTRLATRLILLASVLLLTACSTLDRSEAPPLSSKALWVVLPFANNTETPLAGSRAEAIAEGLLRSNGISRLRRYPASLQQDALFEPGGRKEADAALAWAREQGARYALSGSVDEWRYKVGVDGEPAVGIALSIVDVASGETLWSGVGGKSGWSREALSAVAQQLMRSLLGAGLAARQD
ncbi:MAG: penicillin-binding protein activator LpoB [Rhodocyclales bacterium]|nr:penicillin-binding protein activator LpoB [Rhodocyclales bacterium]